MANPQIRRNPDAIIVASEAEEATSPSTDDEAEHRLPHSMAERTPSLEHTQEIPSNTLQEEETPQTSPVPQPIAVEEKESPVVGEPQANERKQYQCRDRKKPKCLIEGM